MAYYFLCISLVCNTECWVLQNTWDCSSPSDVMTQPRGITRWSLQTQATVPPRPQDFFPDIPQCHLLPSFPRWADPLEPDLIQAQTQHQPLVAAAVCGCGADSLRPPGPALQAQCHRVGSHHSLWHHGLAHQAAECLWRVCLNTGN